MRWSGNTATAILQNNDVQPITAFHLTTKSQFSDGSFLSQSSMTDFAASTATFGSTSRTGGIEPGKRYERVISLAGDATQRQDVAVVVDVVVFYDATWVSSNSKGLQSIAEYRNLNTTLYREWVQIFGNEELHSRYRNNDTAGIRQFLAGNPTKFAESHQEDDPTFGLWLRALQAADVAGSEILKGQYQAAEGLLAAFERHRLNLPLGRLPEVEKGVASAVKNCAYISWTETTPPNNYTPCTGEVGFSGNSLGKTYRLQCIHDSVPYHSENIVATASGQCYKQFEWSSVVVCNPIISAQSYSATKMNDYLALDVSKWSRKVQTPNTCVNDHYDLDPYPCTTIACGNCQAPGSCTEPEFPQDPCHYMDGCPDGWVPGSYNCCQQVCPLLIDMSGDGFLMTSLEGGVEFDMNGDGRRDRIAWTTAGGNDGWLAIDLNNNGTIDSGKELFGNFSQQVPTQTPNGFLALAEFDKPANGGNADGRISSADSVYSKLLIWVDSDHDGRSIPAEITRWVSTGLEIDLRYHESRRKDEFGNEFRYWSLLRGGRGSLASRKIVDVFLVAPTPTPSSVSCSPKDRVMGNERQGLGLAKSER